MRYLICFVLDKSLTPLKACYHIVAPTTNLAVLVLVNVLLWCGCMATSINPATAKTIIATSTIVITVRLFILLVYHPRRERTVIRSMSSTPVLSFIVVNT